MTRTRRIHPRLWDSGVGGKYLGITRLRIDADLGIDSRDLGETTARLLQIVVNLPVSGNPYRTACREIQFYRDGLFIDLRKPSYSG